ISSTDTLWALKRTASARLPSGVNTTCATLSGIAMVSVTLTSVPLMDSTLTELSPRLATSAILPDGLMLSPEGCLPPVIVAASLGGLALRSMTNILLSGTCLRLSPSLVTSTESATSAIEPVGSMSRLTSGPTTEFSSGSVATILGLSGLARSTIMTVSLPGKDMIGLPSPSHNTFSSQPTIMNGLACAMVKAELQSRIAAPKDNPTVRVTGIVAFSRYDRPLMGRFRNPSVRAEPGCCQREAGRWSCECIQGCASRPSLADRLRRKFYIFRARGFQHSNARDAAAL